MNQLKQWLIFFLMLSSANLAVSNELTPEVLIGYIRDQQGMVFQVYSGGCTEKDDFQISVDNRQSGTFLTLYRIRPDYCKGLMPFGRTIKFTYRELNVSSSQSVQILNPINPGFIF